MNIERRGFFKIISAGIASTLAVKNNYARPNKKLPIEAVGILYDATLCIGCKSCEVACKRANNKIPVHSEVEKIHGVKNIWDCAKDLDSNTLNKIKIFRNGEASVKDRAINGFSFVKRACMHCVDPDCISACPVSALTKDPVTGVVTYNINACCGCRYCQVACPYEIPKFEYHKAFPQLVKCEMCSHILAQGGIPACCEFCPTGASIFGKVSDLLEEADRRLKIKAGEKYDFPVSTVKSDEKNTHTIAEYIDHIYGEKEGGGTQYIILSAVPFEKLGLPVLPEVSDASRSEGLQHTLYKGLIAPIALFGGLSYLAFRNMKKKND
jgi:Fe-S-cluster-containing dehydrogenase component